MARAAWRREVLHFCLPRGVPYTCTSSHADYIAARGLLARTPLNGKCLLMQGLFHGGGFGFLSGGPIALPPLLLKTSVLLSRRLSIFSGGELGRIIDVEKGCLRQEPPCSKLTNAFFLDVYELRVNPNPIP